MLQHWPLTIFTLFFIPSFIWAGETSEVSTPSQTESVATSIPSVKKLPDLKEIEVSGPYCGIFSLLACLDTYNIHPELKELLVPEFVGSYQGSSDAELIKAVEKFGLHGKAYANLTWQELQKTNSPMILHFRSSYSDQKFNHWVAFLGVEGGKARVIDLPHELATMPFAELLAKWDGTAILISREPIRDEMAALSKLHYFSLIALLLGVAFLLQMFFWDKSKEAFAAPTLFLRLKRGFLQVAVLLGVLFVFGVLYHAFAGVGFLKNPSAVAEVTRRYYSVDVPEITLAEMENLLKDQDTAIFDARYVRDFQHGTLPKARSLSINSNLNERQEILHGIDKNRRIIAFCQSSGCGYADEVAQFLKFNGYHNVVIYRGGYREWSQKYKEEPKTENSETDENTE